jgi:Fic family protein
MNKRAGIYLPQKLAGESYQAYVPASLQAIAPQLDLKELAAPLEKATLALAELNSISQMIPNPSLFIYMYVRKEALLSSQIEGTQSSFSDLMLFEHEEKTGVSLEDVEEVSYYVKAIQYGLERLQHGFPLCLRLLCEIHAVLLSGGRGAGMLPGEFRRSQNWIGGTRPGNALFVPPPVEPMQQCLYELEEFLHNTTLPALIKAGMIHVQFETIHPFLDGNGRVGRLLIILLLIESRVLSLPTLYVSLHLKQNRQQYYDLLQQVRENGRWEAWLEFFLEGVCRSAKQAVQTALQINQLFEKHCRAINALGRARLSCETVFNYLKKLPQVTVPLLVRELKITPPAVRKALNHLLLLDIVQEVSGKKRDRVYVYREYLELLEKDAKPL